MVTTLLVIGWVWPEPKSSAAGHNLLSLLRAFRAQKWRVVFASCAEPTAHSHPLTELGIETQSIAVNNSDFDVWVGQLQPDIVLFDRYLMEEQFGWRVAQTCPNALRVLDTEDLQCLRFARRLAHRAGRDFAQADLNNDISLREIAAIYRSDLALIISLAEMDLLQKQFNVPASQLFYRPLLTAGQGDFCPLSAAQAATFGQRRGFITIGNYRHEPNWDSVLFLRELWPEVRARITDASLSIYGAYLPPKARQLHNEKIGFCVHGWVDDARQVISQARVCAAPLRFGAGQKGKLLLAMCAGTPSVTTSLGAESMVAGQPWPGAIVDDAEGLVAAMVTLHEDEFRWQRAQADGFVWLQSLNPAEADRQLIFRIESLLAELAEHRANHFVGAMLRHHQHQSTEYFSRWIETKNRLPKSRP